MEWNEGTTSAGMNTNANTNANTMNSGSPVSMDEAKEKARQAATDAQRRLSEQLRTRADSTRTRAADALGSVAQALAGSVQQLRDENQGVSGDYVERAGNQIRRVSEYLRNTNTDDMVRNAESFARRQPAVFLGGAFVLGFLAARLVKSTQGSSNAGGNIPHDRSLVPRTSAWNTDREAPVSGFREPSSSTGIDEDTDAAFTRQFGRETL
jgi:hypothetical protein